MGRDIFQLHSWKKKEGGGDRGLHVCFERRWTHLAVSFHSISCPFTDSSSSSSVKSWGGGGPSSSSPRINRIRSAGETARRKRHVRIQQISPVKLYISAALVTGGVSTGWAKTSHLPGAPSWKGPSEQLITLVQSNNNCENPLSYTIEAHEAQCHKLCNIRFGWRLIHPIVWISLG